MIWLRKWYQSPQIGLVNSTQNERILNLLKELFFTKATFVHNEWVYTNASNPKLHVVSASPNLCIFPMCIWINVICPLFICRCFDHHLDISFPISLLLLILVLKIYQYVLSIYIYIYSPTNYSPFIFRFIKILWLVYKPLNFHRNAPCCLAKVIILTSFLGCKWPFLPLFCPHYFPSHLLQDYPLPKGCREELMLSLPWPNSLLRPPHPDLPPLVTCRR